MVATQHHRNTQLMPPHSEVTCRISQTSCCLYEGSCSSSITINLAAAKTTRSPSASPKQYEPRPVCAANQWSRRSPSAIPLCKVAICMPAKRARKCASNCGVKLISGTRIKTLRIGLRVKTCAVACKYTSVLPLPVTPCRRMRQNQLAQRFDRPRSAVPDLRLLLLIWVDPDLLQPQLWLWSCFRAFCSFANFLRFRSSDTDFKARRLRGKAGTATSPKGR